jgi:AraC family transcriptional regulator
MEGNMRAPGDGESAVNLEAETGQNRLGNSVWQVPRLEISKIYSSPSITVMSCYWGGGQILWRSDRHHRLVFTPDPLSPQLIQIDQERTRQMSAVPAGNLAYCPPGLTLRKVSRAARFVRVVWDADLYSNLLPELGAAVSRFEYQYALQDPLLSQIVTTLAEEEESDFADKILIESLGTAMFIRIAQRFVGRLQLPTGKGLSPQRLQRVRDYVEAHLDDDLSLTVLADIACLSPYHFSRSFKQATGVGPQRYVIQRRLERAKSLLRRTHQPLAWIAQQAGFADQSHLIQIFRREIGVTPGRFRAAAA